MSPIEPIVARILVRAIVRRLLGRLEAAANG